MDSTDTESFGLKERLVGSNSKRRQRAIEKDKSYRALCTAECRSIDSIIPRKLRAKKSKEDYVYFITDGKEIKIGVSRSPFERMAGLKYSRRAKLFLMSFIRGGYTKEQELHKHFQYCRSEGEWFHPAIELMAYIRGINAAWSRG